MTYFLAMDTYIRKFFKGIVVNKDILPEREPALYILNHDVHWCAAFFSGNLWEFFDSFGNGPGIFKKMLRHEVIFNTVSVQDNGSTMCGHHCIFFSYHRCRGMTFNKIMKLYGSDKKKNDMMVQDFVSKYGSWYKPAL